MKSRLSSTIWALVLLNGLVFLVVLWLAFGAGKKAGEASLFDFGSPAGGSIIFALVLALGTSVILAWRFGALVRPVQALAEDRKSTRLNSSHLGISYAVFCLKKKNHYIGSTMKHS